jgi:hypothetical protein
MNRRDSGTAALALLHSVRRAAMRWGVTAKWMKRQDVVTGGGTIGLVHTRLDGFVIRSFECLWRVVVPVSPVFDRSRDRAHGAAVKHDGVVTVPRVG